MGRDARASEHRLPEDLLGSVLGTCTLERILGRGGMGVVYLAQQSRPHRQVAVKTLLLSLMPDPERRRRFLERFRREADAVAALDHANILPIYEYGEQGDVAYLVMPYVAGGTLRDRVERKGQLPLPEVAGFLAQAAAALDYAHTHGVIHRDVKPQNMLLYPDKRLMLSDFGIAKVAEQAASDGEMATVPQLTTMGHVVGTPDYIAPEQAMGHQVDARADIYSLGVVLFYLVTGRVPFAGGQPMTVAAKHVSEAPPPPRQFRPDLPSAAERVILRALAKNPADRYRSAGELSQAFRAAISTHPVPAPGPAPQPAPPKAVAPAVVPPPQAPKPPPKGNEVRRQTRQPEAPRAIPGRTPEKPPSGRRWLAIGAAALVVILLSGGAFAFYKSFLHSTTNTPTVTATATHAATPTRTATSTPTQSPTVTVTTTPTLYTAEQFLPQQTDIPADANAQLLTPQTATTPDELKALNLGLVVDPTKGKYNWQKEIAVQADQNGSVYFQIVIGQFAQAADAQTYYADVLTHLKSTQTQPIGQSAVDGLCCDDNATEYNVIFQDQNVVAIVALAVTPPTPQGKTDSQTLATNMDKHVHPSSQSLRPDLRLADPQPRRRAAA
jgi:serine/threonine protein kinase